MPRLTKPFTLLLLLTVAVVSLTAEEYDHVFMTSSPIFVGEESFNTRLDNVRAQNREPLGLILSGGSARAYCHIGVLRQFEKNNLKPDFIVANSMGAIVGMLYASGFSPDDIEYIVSNVDLNSFFDIVWPKNGGLLSQRYFQEALSRLFPNRKFDLKDTFIPIIIPAEDLISERCVWFAEGNFFQIMTAAFAMSGMMEFEEITLPDGSPTILVDAGCVDLGCIKSIAEHFSHNLVVSTAFYTAEVNLRNPIVVIDKTMGIGKGRAMVRDLQEGGYPYIRNDVENFSFMDFAKVDVLISKGDEKASEFFASQRAAEVKAKSGTWTEWLSTNGEQFSKMRSQRSQYAKDFVYGIQHGVEPYSPEFYTNLKIRPNFAGIDTPDLYFNNPVSAGIYGLADYRWFKGRIGAYTDMDSFGADTWLRLHSENGAELLTVAAIDQRYGNGAVSWYGAQQFSWNIPLTANASLTPFAAVEAGSSLFFGRTGVTLAAHNESKTLNFNLSPYGYVLQESFALPDFRAAGTGVKTDFSCYGLPVVGFAVGDSFRWNNSGSGICRLSADNFRGASAAKNPVIIAGAGIPDDGGSSPGLQDSWINISRTDIFLYAPSTSLTAAELFKLEKIRSGLYFDTAVTATGVTMAAGADTCAQISFIGLSTLNLNAYAGWDFSAQSLCGGISIVSSF